MVDLHTHILPQMDDGSQSAEQTLQMLELMRSQGVDIVAATPHYYANRETPQAFLRRRDEAYKKIVDVPTTPKILLGAEVAYFSGLSNCREISSLGIQGSRLILIEMPFLNWNDTVVQEILSVHQHLGLTPVLAHIERYRKMPNFEQALYRFLTSGVLVQCNAQTFCTPFLGKKMLRMLQNGQIHFIGSDCHNLTSRPPNFKKAADKITKAVSAEFLQHLDSTARRLLAL